MINAQRAIDAFTNAQRGTGEPTRVTPRPITDTNPTGAPDVMIRQTQPTNIAGQKRISGALDPNRASTAAAAARAAAKLPEYAPAIPVVKNQSPANQWDIVVQMLQALQNLKK
jgi:hypothetical protein